MTPAAAVAAVLVLLGAAASASAAVPALLTKVPENGEPGPAAGQLHFPTGVAADAHLPGHVFVADLENERVDEFTAWGSFVRAWGWEVDKANPEAKLQTCTEATGCQKGLVGGGAGEFKSPEAVAVDGEGNVYVIEAEGHRVQKFDPGAEGEEANFLLTFGLDVNKTKVEAAAPQAERNRCPVDPGDVCQAGTAGSGAGQLGKSKLGYLNRLAASPATNDVFVGEGERIQAFNPDGTLKEEIEGGDLAGKSLQALATDSAGKLYAAFEGQAEVHKLEPSSPGTFVGPTFPPELAAERPLALGLDGAGNLYTTLPPSSEEPRRAQEYDENGNCLTCGTGGEGGKPGFDRTAGSQLLSVAAGSACGADDAYVAHFSAKPATSFLDYRGNPPSDTVGCPRPPAPPQIKAQYATTVEVHGAEVEAQINPKFWEDTAYQVEYGTGECKAGGCPLKTAKAKLTSQIVSSPLASGGVLLEGLEPATTYHFRFIAESGGGGPVFGVDPDGPEGPEEASETAGLEGSFTTYRETSVELCPANETFRAGVSALLPDCRAYEMVSPLDKEGGDITVLPSSPTLLPSALFQAGVEGEKLAYGSYRAFGSAQGGAFSSEYVAARRAGVGWQTHAVSPPRGKAILAVLLQTQADFTLFSPDLCAGWLQSVAEPPLAPGAPAGAIDLYRRSDEECGGPSYLSLNAKATDNGLNLELQGVSEDEGTAVFIANKALAAGGTEGQTQLYGAQGGKEKFLCILPGGTQTPYGKSCTAGTVQEKNFDAQENQVQNALSADGTRVYWTATEKGAGKIYLRENPFGSGTECVKETAPCTLEVSAAAEAEAGSTGSEFWAAARNGSAAIFTTGDLQEGKATLYEYRLADKSTHEIAKEVVGVMGASEDASRVYFASREDRDSGGPAEAGEINLYLHEAGGTPAYRFIGALAAGENPSPIAANLQNHVSRVSPDGEAAAFSSFAPLTGFDNTDRHSGKADAELFLYDARANGGAGQLVCASCNPAGARPAGQEFLFGGQSIGPWTAARIPVAESVLYSSRVLAEDGRRLFFDSYDTLSPRDTNGRSDVYQWEAPGEGNCKESSPTYSPANGGCVDLISSGTSPLDSELLDASPSGNDVFLTTISSLVPQDYGLQDAYDARVDGGLPPPPPPPNGCEGEACQHPAPVPGAATPSSESYEGPEDRAKAAKKGCPKGRHRVKGRCVKKKHQKHEHHRRKRSQQRRAGR